MRPIRFWLSVALLLLSACSDDSGSPDTTAPAAVLDLTVQDSSGSSVTLVWTAPGDDGASGRAAQYDIRCAADLLSSGNWDAAAVVDTTRVPKPGGQAETLVVAGLSAGAWWFALKAADEVPNWSGLSNIVGTSLIDTMPPAPVSDLATGFATTSGITLTWTAPGDDGNDRAASQYDLRYALTPITEETWAEAWRVEGVPAPAAAGATESFLVTNLEMGVTYSFALKAIDDAHNESTLSNVVSGATASMTRLTFSPGPNGAFSPQWSPDGSHITFVIDQWVGGTNRDVDLFMVSAGGGEPVRLTADPDRAFSPSWSPDGTRLAFISSRTTNSEIYIMNAIAGAEPVQVTAFQGSRNPTVVRWSPDGNQFAYVDMRSLSPSCKIFIMPSMGGASTFVCEGSWILSIDWSPDGSRLAFTAYLGTSPDGNFEIWIVPVSGGAATRLTRDPGSDQWPAWSPDGNQIMFASDRDGSGDLWLMSADGEDLIQVTSDSAGDWTPHWSPDGSRIAFARRESGVDDIWILDSHEDTMHAP